VKTKISPEAKLLLASVERTLSAQYTQRIVKCLEQLPEEQIWWRPNPASNSVGNMVLHLSGNVRQWIISGLGGAPDMRERDREFAEQGPIPGRELSKALTKTVKEACKVLRNLSEPALSKKHIIQGFHVTGLEVVYHVAEHFAYHAGQIIYVTKNLSGKDLQFTHLPAVKQKASKAKP
jgi:uncharacterized damage-inducible protein DinB